MLIAHLVPGYFAASLTSADWPTSWSHNQRRVLWITAFGSTVAPDIDVIYNILVRGFANHSVLWTHSLFPYVGLGLVWVLLRRIPRWPFLCMLVELATLGGFSHLLLDVIVHGTPLLYPFSLTMVGWPPQQVIEGGVWGYVTHPIFLLEPLLIGFALLHWLWQRSRLNHSIL